MVKLEVTISTQPDRGVPFKLEVIGVVLLVMALLPMGGCASPCRNSLVRKVVSPDLTKKVVLFYRNCGATGDYTTEVSILMRGEAMPMSDIGNTARMGHDQSMPRPPSRREYIDLGVEWLSPRELVITIPSAVEIETMLPKSADVAVTYARAEAN
jgi:hypothetical protein